MKVSISSKLGSLGLFSNMSNDFSPGNGENFRNLESIIIINMVKKNYFFIVNQIIYMIFCKFLHEFHNNIHYMINYKDDRCKTTLCKEIDKFKKITEPY